MTSNYSRETVLTTVDTEPYIELDNQGQKKILTLAEEINFLGRDPSWANMPAPKEWNIISRKQAIIEKEGNHYRIYDGDRHHKWRTASHWTRSSPTNNSDLLQSQAG